MPFELFPATRSTEKGKRKQGYDAGSDSQKDAVAGRGKEAETASDEEVEEFFSILKRLHAASKHIEKIDGASRLLMGKRSKLMKSSEEEADEVEIRAERIPSHKLDRNLDLDLNLEPVCVELDGKTSRSLNPKPECVDSAADSCWILKFPTQMNEIDGCEDELKFVADQGKTGPIQNFILLIFFN